MNIAGVVVHARPEKLAGVESQLLELPGVEIHATAEDGHGRNGGRQGIKRIKCRRHRHGFSKCRRGIVDITHLSPF